MQRKKGKAAVKNHKKTQIAMMKISSNLTDFNPKTLATEYIELNWANFLLLANS
jgi:hypothetical protein